ncbi:MAG: hypothetical protein JNM42_03380 [Propionivibrio sp.]|uniref:hypothetical protein n=1 Tax=Propionivibrio sp. TaxID=2212460 RepID=UPI001A42E1AF|nr:hypothetical protein [Propionivibrio sp.]MBL8413460.1 hypothetical protein [Propionivibrio sp.]
MGILDWFKNRPAQFDPDRPSDDMTLRAIDKAVTLTNPRLKLVRSYQERLAPAVETSVNTIREMVLSLPQPIRVSAACWSGDPVLRAFFVAASDIPYALGRSSNLRTLIDKYPTLDEAYFILVMTYNEQRMLGMSLQGDVVQRDVVQTVIGFSDHEARICGHQDTEVRRLLGTQAYEYLVAQALSEIGEERSERRELQDNCLLIRARLRLLQQQGPGLGSVFGSAPVVSCEKLKLEAQLLENERQLEAIGSPQSALDAELETLRQVLEHPERYIHVEKKRMRISTMNVVLDQESTDVASDIGFSLAQLKGVPQIQRAFVLACFARAELPEARMNFDDAIRYL